MFYVYAIKDPRTGEPIYIGKGTDRRMQFHWWQMLNDDKPIQNPKLRNKLTHIFRLGYSNPAYEKLFQSKDEKLCYWMERFWISVYGRVNLCNLSDGGDGGFGHDVGEKGRERIGAMYRGKTLSEEHRRRIGEGGRGKKHSEETKRKIGEGNKGKTAMNGEKNSFFGRKHTEESLRKMREAKIGNKYAIGITDKLAALDQQTNMDIGS